MRRVAIIAAIILGLAAPLAHAAIRKGVYRPSVPACTAYDTFTVYGNGGSYLARSERAAEIESAYLSEYYGTPCATFAPGGWAVYMTTFKYMASQCAPNSASCHAVNAATQQPYALVGPGVGWWQSVLFIHEVLEMIADPMLTNLALEVCDKGNGNYFPLAGTYAPPFELPNGKMFTITR